MLCAGTQTRVEHRIFAADVFWMSFFCWSCSVYQILINYNWNICDYEENVYFFLVLYIKKKEEILTCVVQSNRIKTQKFLVLVTVIRLLFLY